MLAAGVVTSAGLLFILNRSLLSSVDDAATRRVRDIVAALDFDKAADLDNRLLAIDQRIGAVQVIGGDGRVIRRSASAPDTPLLPVSWFGPSLRAGIPDDLSPNNDMRLSGQTTRTATGTYTVIVGGGSESAEHTVALVALLLAIAAAIITGTAAIANFRLVKRSLRSVETIRSARRRDLRIRPVPTRSGAATKRRDISAGHDNERDARTSRIRPRRATSVRRGCLTRTAQPVGQHPCPHSKSRKSFPKPSTTN